MKDPLDRTTIDPWRNNMAESNLKKFRVNYGYSVKGKLRSGALIIDAKDLTDAKNKAVQQLSDEYDWYNINSIKTV